MNKLFTLIVLFSGALLANAQIKNGGFESLNSDRYANYWAAKFYLLGFHIDSSGKSYSDSISGSFPLVRVNTLEARSGSNALELHNAFNVTAQTSMPGVLFASDDTAGYSGFGNTFIALNDNPEQLQFYYRFKRENTDTAYAAITVYDEAMNEIGKGELRIAENSNIYTEANIDVHYSSSAKAAFAQIVFSTTIPGGVASLGSSLLIDDVNVEFATQINGYNTDNSISVFPNPAHSGKEIQIVSRKNKAVQEAYLYDATGKVLKLEATLGGYNTGNIHEGLYVLVVNTGGNTIYKIKLVIRP